MTNIISTSLKVESLVGNNIVNIWSDSTCSFALDDTELLFGFGKNNQAQLEIINENKSHIQTNSNDYFSIKNWGEKAVSRNSLHIVSFGLIMELYMELGSFIDSGKFYRQRYWVLGWYRSWKYLYLSKSAMFRLFGSLMQSSVELEFLESSIRVICIIWQSPLRLCHSLLLICFPICNIYNISYAYIRFKNIKIITRKFIIWNWY